MTGEYILKKNNLFVKNALLLLVVNIIMRGISVSFNAYVNNKIGAESMGLFTLVMSIYSFSLTVALSCVNLGAVRLTSEKCAALSGADRASWRYAMRRVIRSVSLYSLLFGVSTAVLLYVSADAVAKYLLSDMRTVKSVKILALSLPAISLSSAISGYFTGIRKVSKNAVIAVSEQFVKIVVTSSALVMISPGNVESACIAVVGGAAVSEAWSLILNIVMYIFDSGMPNGEALGKKKVSLNTKLKDTVYISLPSALGTYARQGLTTLEHLAIPSGLKKSGLSSATALASYGLLQGIAFPLVMFPYAVIGSFTSLLIPEIAARKELNDREGIVSLTKNVYCYSAIFSVGACGIFVNYANELGVMVYNSNEAVKYTVVLGLLVPFMYLDTAVDSLLKGIGEQVYTMKVNIIDAACGLIFVILLTPKIGIAGYLVSVWLCEVGNLAASIIKLNKITGVTISESTKFYIRPICVVLLLTPIKLITSGFVNPALSVVLFVLIYISCVFVKTKKKRLVLPSLK